MSDVLENSFEDINNQREFSREREPARIPMMIAYRPSIRMSQVN
jgi:hypothetical protein